MSSSIMATTIQGTSFSPLPRPTAFSMAVSIRTLNGNLSAKTHLLRLITANTSNSGIQEIEEIGYLNSLILWPAKYRLLSSYFSRGMVYTSRMRISTVDLERSTILKADKAYLVKPLPWFLEVMAMVWAGSQVTKLVRAGGALALAAPTVDRGLSWFTVKFKFDSQVKALMVIVGFCLGLAFLMFLVVTIPWAMFFSPIN